jgi:2-polyprenyl-3-methyl-5-hydroxy-6-metoxy-1,4-benzoquinol methylase
MENGNGDTVLGYRDARQSDGTEGYQSFEDVFRGSEEFIRDRQAKYLELLRPFEPVLDIGCGRGEMLDLLRSAGIKAFGVDADEGMVARCREKGLDVRFGDGIELLAGQPEQSVGAIFCAQVIEHLPHEQLIRLFELSRVKLKPRGLLVTETVNPHSLRALKTFWTDVTHRHPIFPETLVALCRSLGFVEARVIHPNGSGRFQDDQWIEGEYAVLAFVPDVAPKTGGKPAAGT